MQCQKKLLAAPSSQLQTLWQNCRSIYDNSWKLNHRSRIFNSEDIKGVVQSKITSEWNTLIAGMNEILDKVEAKKPGAIPETH